MPDLTVTNWFGNIVSHPRVIVDANSVEDIQRVLKDPVSFLHQCARLVPIIQRQPAEWRKTARSFE